MTSDHTEPQPVNEHTIRIFPVFGTSQHIAACSCGRSVTSDDAATAISDLVSGGCMHWTRTPDIPTTEDGD